ncbi:MAG: energy-coupling factor transporter ATPase [Chloroflexi bacterium]|nr:energy-coupling factor transporter ATPase [Chloroflexota bacterium]
MPIEVNDLSFTYAQGTSWQVEALHQLNLSIADGEFIGIIGKTGCGKSTLIQLIAGLLKPTSGSVSIDGQNFFSAKTPRFDLPKKIGVLFQNPEIQLFETTVEKDVAFALKHTPLATSQVNEQVRWALETVGLDYEKFKELPPLSLSGGEMRRVAVAGVLVIKPDILVLDEPIAGLDPKSQDGFLRLLDSFNANGTTIIMISHSLDALAEHAKRILVLEDGFLIRDAGTREVLADSQFLEKHNLGSTQVGQITDGLSKCNLHLPSPPLTGQELCSALLEALV